MSQDASPAGWIDRITAKGPWVLGAWVVGLASWIYLMIVTDFDLFAISVWSVPFLLVLAVLSSPWRSVSFSTLVSLFMLGLGPVLFVVVMVQRLIALTPLEDWVRSLSESLASAGVTTFIGAPSTVVFAPLLEELFKVTPLLVLLWWRRSKLRALAGPIDYAAIAGATGAGFGFGEDILVYLHQGTLFGPPSSVFALNLGPVYRSLTGVIPAAFDSDYTNAMSFLFPEMQYLTGVVWSGHGALAMGLGLAIGLSVWGARRLNSRLLYLVIPVAYLWVVWEHMMANWYGGAGCAQKDLLMCTLADIDLRGRILPVVMVVAWGVGIYMCRVAARYLRSQDSLLGANEFHFAGYRSRGWRGMVSFVGDWFSVRRWRRKTSYGVEYLRFGRHVASGDALSVWAARLRGLEVRGHLTGHPPEVDTDVDVALRRAVPLD